MTLRRFDRLILTTVVFGILGSTARAQTCQPATVGCNAPFIGLVDAEGANCAIFAISQGGSTVSIAMTGGRLGQPGSVSYPGWRLVDKDGTGAGGCGDVHTGERYCGPLAPDANPFRIEITPLPSESTYTGLLSLLNAECPRCGVACNAGEFCDFPFGTCGVGAQGVCTRIPDSPCICTDEVNPFCGCDGQTYNNSCAALCSGVPLLHAGPCVCPGDCDGDGSVTINEIVKAVNVALGNEPAGACTAGDVDGDKHISINELLVGVNRAIWGCHQLAYTRHTTSPDPIGLICENEKRPRLN